MPKLFKVGDRDVFGALNTAGGKAALATVLGPLVGQLNLVIERKQGFDLLERPLARAGADPVVLNRNEAIFLKRLAELAGEVTVS